MTVFPLDLIADYVKYNKVSVNNLQRGSSPVHVFYSLRAYSLERWNKKDKLNIVEPTEY